MAVECDSGEAGDLLDALQDLAGQLFADVALAELGALRVVVFVQLKVAQFVQALVIKYLLQMLKTIDCGRCMSWSTYGRRLV